MDNKDYKKEYLRLLAERYPTARAAAAEIINLDAIMRLPKGTEHFMSDLHGEYEAFCHIMNNCSGVIREKVEQLYGNTMTEKERDEFATFVYYPPFPRILLTSSTSSSTWTAPISIRKGIITKFSVPSCSSIVRRALSSL